MTVKKRLALKCGKRKKKRIRKSKKEITYEQSQRVKKFQIKEKVSVKDVVTPPSRWGWGRHTTSLVSSNSTVRRTFPQQ